MDLQENTVQLQNALNLLMSCIWLLVADFARCRTDDMLSSASPAAGLLGTLAECSQHLEHLQLQCQQDRPDPQQAMVVLLDMCNKMQLF